MRQATNIYLVGAQSTGKTTLTLALADHIRTQSSEDPRLQELDDPHVIIEVARGVMRSNGFGTNETFASDERILQLQALILEAQVREQQNVPTSRWFISDRSGLDPLMYARTHVGTEAAERLEASTSWQKAKSSMADAAVFVTEPNVEWIIADNFRYMPTSGEAHEYWTKLHRMFCEQLEKNEIPFTVVPASVKALEERVAFVLDNWSTTGRG